jgi:hypothetical protein
MVRPAAAQCCGDCNGDGAVTVDELIAAVNRALGDCADDGICGLESCPPQLAACREELADCRAQPGGQRFPASGQTTAYGPGSDGDVQAGATLSLSGNWEIGDVARIWRKRTTPPIPRYVPLNSLNSDPSPQLRVESADLPQACAGSTFSGSTPSSLIACATLVRSI